MKMLKIPKRSGGTRTICVPSAKRKRECRALIPALQDIVRRVCDLEVVHGFAELRSPVTNAAKHVGFQYTVSFDLKDFFDTVKMTNLGGLYLGGWGFHSCFHKGIARQGLPTSPIVANIAAARMDSNITASLEGVTRDGDPLRYAYTRYADDLTISFDKPEYIPFVKGVVATVVDNAGFVLNDHKTTVQCAQSGRRIVTGIAVDDVAMYPTRKVKRRLRAAIHNAKTGRVKHFPSRQWTRYVKACRHRGHTPMPKRAWVRRWLHARVRGLEEWIKLRPPGVGRRSAGRIADHLPPADALAAIAARGHKP